MKAITIPFPTYLHSCNKCSHVIMESEWDVVKERRQRMSFTTPCFIRKNSKELRDKIYYIGNRNGANLWDDEFNTILAVDNDSFRCWDDEWGNSGALIRKGYIDCGTNSDLFLAIAALRDDTSYGQYWVFDEDFTPYAKGDFVIGTFSRCSCYCHKATVSELITYFKNKEEQ